MCAPAAPSLPEFQGRTSVCHRPPRRLRCRRPWSRPRDWKTREELQTGPCGVPGSPTNNGTFEGLGRGLGIWREEPPTATPRRPITRDFVTGWVQTWSAVVRYRGLRRGGRGRRATGPPGAESLGWAPEGRTRPQSRPTRRGFREKWGSNRSEGSGGGGDWVSIQTRVSLHSGTQKSAPFESWRPVRPGPTSVVLKRTTRLSLDPSLPSTRHVSTPHLGLPD